MEALEVLQPGAFTTVQDLGRYGYQKYGVSISGAMDRFALRVANLLVGNEEREAALEATVMGPKLRALRNLRVAFTGADLSAQVNGRPVPMWSALEIGKGEVISFGYPESGCQSLPCPSRRDRFSRRHGEPFRSHPLEIWAERAGRSSRGMCSG